MRASACRAALLLVTNLLVTACDRQPALSLVEHAGRGELSGGGAVTGLSFLGQAHARALGRLEDQAGQTRCTASLIGERRVLSAAHCFALTNAATELEVAEALAGLGFRGEQQVLPLVALERHPTLDLAVVTLGDALIGAAPLPRDEGSSEALLGREVFVVGAGVGTPEEERVSAGSFSIAGVEDTLLELSPTAGAGLCPGDSGGPVLLDDSGAPLLVGAHSIGFDDCSPPSYSVRLDVAAEWLEAVLSQPLPSSSSPCSEGAPARCVDGRAESCVAGYWRVVDCEDLERTCEESGEGAACAPVPCGSVPAAGVCEDGVARVCLAGSLVEEDCAAQGLGCGVDPNQGRKSCLPCTVCDGTCVDLESDSRNCGACGNACVPDGRGRCREGSCEERERDDAGPPASSADAGTGGASDGGCQGQPLTFAAFFGAWLLRVRRRRRPVGVSDGARLRS